MLISEQEKAVAALAQAGLKVNIQTTVYPGINDQHVAAIAEKMSRLGASSMTLLPFAAAEGEDGPPSCDAAMLAQAKAAAAAHLELAEYGATLLSPTSSGTAFAGTLLPKPTQARPNVAVVSSSGMEVDLHLGQAEKILIYGPRGGDELPSLRCSRCATRRRQAQEAPAGRRWPANASLTASPCWQPRRARIRRRCWRNRASRCCWPKTALKVWWMCSTAAARNKSARNNLI